MRRRSAIQRSFTLQSQGLGRRVATGAAFQFLGIGMRTALTLGSTAVLARLLTPADFGFVAMATVVTEFAAMLSAFGFTNLLIQRRTITRLQLDTVFWATMGVECVLAVVVFILSFASGWLFAEQQVGSLLRVLCLSFVINGLATVPSVVLSRQLRFQTEFWINVAGIVIRIAAAIASAAAGHGAWSLVVGGLVGGIVSVVLRFAVVPYVPRWRFHWPYLKSTWRTSGSYFGSTLLYYVSCNLDLLLIGRMLGAAPLGYYQNARSLTDEIRARIAMPIQHVLFPAFSAVQTERERFQALVLRAGRLLAAVVVPVGIGVSANARELVLVLYGEQWTQMIPVMALFGIAGAVRAATAIGSPLFNATNHVGLAFRYNLVGTALLIVGVLVAMPHGIAWVGAAVAATSLYSLVTLRAALGFIGLGTLHLLKILGLPFVAATVMWAVTEALRQTTAGWHAGPALAVQVAIGALSYLTALHLLSRQYWNDVKEAGVLITRRA